MADIAAPVPSEGFIRTRFTWMNYAFMGYFPFGLALLGPAMPFIGEKMGLTYTQMAFHFTAMSLGSMVTGLFGDRIARMLGGGARVGWIGSAWMCVMLPFVVFGNALWMTVIFTFLFGIGIGMMAMTGIGMLAQAHPQHQAQVFVETGIVAGIATIAAPLLVGLVAGSMFGWQAMVYLLPVVLIAMLALFRGVTSPIKTKSKRDTQTIAAEKQVLPVLFWVFGAMMFITVALEWVMFSWSANFLTVVAGYEAETAASLVSVFAVALLVGRIIGRPLLAYWSDRRVLMLSLVWVLVFFPVFWLASSRGLMLAGMFLMGLGVGNTSPLAMSGAMAAAGDQSVRAGARLGLFPSISNVTMLQLVGSLADQVGIQKSFGVVVVLTVLGIGILVAANRMQVQKSVSMG